MLSILSLYTFKTNLLFPLNFRQFINMSSAEDYYGGSIFAA